MTAKAAIVASIATNDDAKNNMVASNHGNTATSASTNVIMLFIKMTVRTPPPCVVVIVMMVIVLCVVKVDLSDDFRDHFLRLHCTTVALHWIVVASTEISAATSSTDFEQRHSTTAN